jgi:hypothetical protein
MTFYRDGMQINFGKYLANSKILSVQLVKDGELVCEVNAPNIPHDAQISLRDQRRFARITSRFTNDSEAISALVTYPFCDGWNETYYFLARTHDGSIHALSIVHPKNDPCSIYELEVTTLANMVKIDDSSKASKKTN